MSETVHYRGKLTEVTPNEGESIQEYSKRIMDERGKELVSYYGGDYVYGLSDEFYEEYQLLNGTLYHLKKEIVDIDETIVRAHRNEDGSISYEVRYYNGGAGLEEVLTEALNKMESE